MPSCRGAARFLLLLLAGAVTACGTSAAVTIGAPPTVTAPATTTTVAPTTVVPTATTAAPPSALDVCALLSDADLSPVFPTGAPPSDRNDYGEGFSDCSWDDGRTEVLVTTMPAANLRSDYIGQLNVSDTASGAGLGDDAVYFPGVVGLGKASAGGTSIGFTKGERGVIVAVRTGDANDPAALQHATALAVLIAGRI